METIKFLKELRKMRAITVPSLTNDELRLLRYNLNLRNFELVPKNIKLTVQHNSINIQIERIKKVDDILVDEILVRFTNKQIQ